MGRARRLPAAAVLRRGDRVGRHRGAAPAAAGSGCRGRGRARRPRRAHPHGRLDVAARAVRRGAASAHRPRASRPRRVGARAVPRRGGATDAGPRASAAGSSSSTWRAAARCTSTCPRRSAPSGTASAAASSRRTRSSSTTASRLAELRRRRRARRAQLPPPGHRPARRRARRHGAAPTTASCRRSSPTGDGYVVGVQWHPEENAEDRRLFAGLVAEASAYRRDPRTANGVAAHDARTFTVINPATGEPLARDPARDARPTSMRRSRAPSSRSARGRRSPPVARADALRAFARVVEAHGEELAQLEVLNSGHPIGSARWEASHVAQVLNFYAGAPERLSGQQIPVAGGLDVTFHEPYGVVGIIVPWNFPMTIASWGFAPALAAGNAVRAQARRADAAHRDPARRARARGGAARGAVPGGDRVGLGRRAAVRLAPGRAQGRVHRIDRGRHGCRGRLRPRAQARHARTRRQERQHRVRRRRPREGGRRRRRARCSTTPARTAARAAASSCSAACTTGSSSCSSRPCRRGGSATPPLEDDRHGPARSRRRTATPSRPSSTARDVAFRGSAPEGDGFWFAPTVVLAEPRRPHRAGGGLRPGRRGAAVRRRGRRDPPRERHDLRARRVDLDREPRPRHPRRRAASRAACCRSTRTRRCATGRRSAA